MDFVWEVAQWIGTCSARVGPIPESTEKPGQCGNYLTFDIVITVVVVILSMCVCVSTCVRMHT